MIVDASEANLVSTQGWVDKGAVWWCRTASSRRQTISWSDASYLTVHKGSDDLFAVVHHYNPPREHQLKVTAHALADPPQVLAGVTLQAEGQGPVWEGDASVWDRLPRAYLAYYRQNGNRYDLLLVDGRAQHIEMQRFSWFEDGSYDQGYQAPLEAIELPGSELLLVSIQRDAQPVLYDPRQQKAIGKIYLANRAGNPHMEFRRTAVELWASDYDTLVRLDPRDWSIMNAQRLQLTPSEGNSKESAGTAQFIGGFAFNRDESLCAVARPFSGDVIALDTGTFEVRYRAVTGGQPLDVALLSDGRVFCRDWKSGELLLGRLE
jgi:hypothetical protein